MRKRALEGRGDALTCGGRREIGEEIRRFFVCFVCLVEDRILRDFMCQFPFSPRKGKQGSCQRMKKNVRWVVGRIVMLGTRYLWGMEKENNQGNYG